MSLRQPCAQAVHPNRVPHTLGHHKGHYTHLSIYHSPCVLFFLIGFVRDNDGISIKGECAPF